LGSSESIQKYTYLNKLITKKSYLEQATQVELYTFVTLHLCCWYILGLKNYCR